MILKSPCRVQSVEPQNEFALGNHPAQFGFVERHMTSKRVAGETKKPVP
jgi:hypothetical protein